MKAPAIRPYWCEMNAELAVTISGKSEISYLECRGYCIFSMSCPAHVQIHMHSFLQSIVLDWSVPQKV